MKQFIALVAVFFANQHASAVEILNARTDAATQSIVLTVLQTDCNSLFGRLQYLYSNKRIDGPHHYNLDFFQTQIGCPRFAPKAVDIKVAIPANHRPGDSIIIRNKATESYEQVLSFRITRPVKSLPIVMEGYGQSTVNWPPPPPDQPIPDEHSVR